MPGVGECIYCKEKVNDYTEAINHALNCTKTPRYIKRQMVKKINKANEKHTHCEICGDPCDPHPTGPRCKKHINTVMMVPPSHFLNALRYK